jgi:hypothetical protein
MMKPNCPVSKSVWWFTVFTLIAIVIFYRWYDDQQIAKEVARLNKQEMMLRSLMMAHSPPWTNVEFTAIPLKDIIIARGTVQNQTELDELRHELLNSGVLVSIYVDAIDTNTVK